MSKLTLLLTYFTFSSSSNSFKQHRTPSNYTQKTNTTRVTIFIFAILIALTCITLYQNILTISTLPNHMSSSTTLEIHPDLQPYPISFIHCLAYFLYRYWSRIQFSKTNIRLSPTTFITASLTSSTFSTCSKCLPTSSSFLQHPAVFHHSHHLLFRPILDHKSSLVYLFQKYFFISFEIIPNLSTHLQSTILLAALAFYKDLKIQNIPFFH